MAIVPPWAVASPWRAAGRPQIMTVEVDHDHRALDGRLAKGGKLGAGLPFEAQRGFGVLLDSGESNLLGSQVKFP